MKEQRRAEYRRSAERYKERARVRYWNDPEARRRASAAYRAANPEKVREILRRNYLRNREVRLAAGRAWRTEHPEKMREYQRAYLERHPDRRRMTGLGYRMRNRDAIREASRSYQEANPGIYRESRLRRRARLASAETCEVTAADWASILRQQGGHGSDACFCAYCGEWTVGPTVDHVIPISRGGRHAVGNLRAACLPCNQQKHCKLLVEWRAWRQRAHALETPPA